MSDELTTTQREIERARAAAEQRTLPMGGVFSRQGGNTECLICGARLRSNNALGRASHTRGKAHAEAERRWVLDRLHAFALFMDRRDYGNGRHA